MTGTGPRGFSDAVFICIILGMKGADKDLSGSVSEFGSL
jgi:hypothetical protein